MAKEWFEDYLYNRKQIVKYNGVQSDEMTIRSGVPQGSILGPLLFLLYINDIHNCSELISIVLFADDTNILYSHTCLKKLNEIIQVEINIPKYTINISININIKKVKNTTFLGIVIDEFLTWCNHLDLITKKLLNVQQLFPGFGISQT